MGRRTESIFINEKEKMFYATEKFQNHKHTDCRALKNLTIGELTHERTKLLKDGYKRAYARDFEHLREE